jgi:hypothetical protein
VVNIEIFLNFRLIGRLKILKIQKNIKFFPDKGKSYHFSFSGECVDEPALDSNDDDLSGDVEEAFDTGMLINRYFIEKDIQNGFYELKQFVKMPLNIYNSYVDSQLCVYKDKVTF